MAVTWLIIGILVVAAFLLLKALHIKHRVTLGILIFLAVFVYFTLSAVIISNNLELNTTEGFFGTVKVYAGWLGNGYHNLKILTGNAVNLDWTDINGTFANNTK